MKLSKTHIGGLASRRVVKQVAVSNFLGTLGGLTRDEALANVEQDAKSYRWNVTTSQAIREGILEAEDEL